MTNRKSKRLTAFLWHRRIGLLAIVLVMILAITGIMLNHTEEFELDSNYLESGLILDWYGLQPEGEPVSYAVYGHTVSQWQQQIFFDKKIISTSAQNLRGAIKTEHVIVVAFEKELLLLSDQGEIVERIPSTVNEIQSIGVKDKRAAIATVDKQFYLADENIIDWQATADDGIAWSATISIDDRQREQLLQSYRGNGLSLERVILDLHSGRIFGRYGVYIMDAAAIALLWLSFSGLWVWWSRRQKQKSKKHYRKHHRD